MERNLQYNNLIGVTFLIPDDAVRAGAVKTYINRNMISDSSTPQHILD